MRHLLIAAVLLTAIPALALAAGHGAPPDAGPHPGASAHANAVSGQAAASRIEACGAAANTLIDNLHKGDYQAATADFDATMKAGLGSHELGQVWQNIGGQVGKLTGRGAAQNAMYQGRAIVTVPLHFQNGMLNAQVACDADGKIAGFYLRPATASL